MNSALLAAATQLLRDRRAYALATVVRRERPSSAAPGNTAVITTEGRVHGWIGGSCTQPEVVRHARRAIAAGRPRLVGFGAQPGERDGVVAAPMSCGSEGKVDVHINPVLPVPRLVIAGKSPVAEAVARVGGAVGWEVVRWERAASRAAAEAGLEGDPARDTSSNEDTSSSEDTSSNEGRSHESREAWTPSIGSGRAPGDRLFAVVATMGQGDEAALEALAAAQPDYLGVVASPKRMRQLRRGLVAAGVDEAVAARVRGPAGLDIGAVRPEEVAVSIVAEIVAAGREPDGGRARAGESGKQPCCATEDATVDEPEGGTGDTPPKPSCCAKGDGDRAGDEVAEQACHATEDATAAEADSRGPVQNSCCDQTPVKAARGGASPDPDPDLTAILNKAVEAVEKKTYAERIRDRTAQFKKIRAKDLKQRKAREAAKKQEVVVPTPVKAAREGTVRDREAAGSAHRAHRGDAGSSGDAPGRGGVGGRCHAPESSREGMAENPAGAPKMATDPVCGMTVPADGSRPSFTHNGHTVHFCCPGCRERYAANPAAWA